jgi:hypothetical protein
MSLLFSLGRFLLWLLNTAENTEMFMYWIIAASVSSFRLRSFQKKTTNLF